MYNKLTMENNQHSAEYLMKRMIIKYMRYIKTTYGEEGLRKLRADGCYFPPKVEVLKRARLANPDFNG